MAGAAAARIVPRAHEITWGENDLIVSKADPKGVITYANDVFIKVSGYTEQELIGQPHSILRHPDSPGGVFKLLWDTINAGQEVFAYVKNLAKDGSYYWVLAHVTPSYDAKGRLVGHHSNRRCPDRGAIAEIEPIYAQMKAEESRHTRRIDAATAGLGLLAGLMQDRGVTYEEFVWDIITRHDNCTLRAGRAA